jgi:hypothetical protein
MRMTEMSEKTTKAGNKMLVARFQIINGDFKNRIVFENFLLDHSNEKVVEISLNRLDNYAKAIGIEGGLEELGNDVGSLSNYIESPFIGSLKQKEPYNGKVDSRVAKFKRR